MFISDFNQGNIRQAYIGTLRSQYANGDNIVAIESDTTLTIGDRKFIGIAERDDTFIDQVKQAYLIAHGFDLIADSGIAMPEFAECDMLF